MNRSFFTAAWHDRIRLDPRSKLLLLIITSMAMFTGSLGGAAIWIRPLFGAIPVILIFASKKYVQGVFCLLLLAGCWYSENFLLEANTAAVVLIASITTGVVFKMAPTIAMGVYFVNSTTLGELLASLQKLRVPTAVTIPLAVVFRFLPTIAQESGKIKDSMYLRGIRPSNPIAYMEYRMVPLLISVTKIGDELSAAALTKGLGSPVKRVPVVDLHFRAVDGLFCAAAILAAAAYIVLRG